MNFTVRRVIILSSLNNIMVINLRTEFVQLQLVKRGGTRTESHRQWLYCNVVG
jgi:hypothetical protein